MNAQTFALRGRPARCRLGLLDLTCPGANTCYSVGNQGTITASTNGDPFLPQPSATSHDLYGVTCLERHTWFAVGNKGTVLRKL